MGYAKFSKRLWAFLLDQLIILLLCLPLLALISFLGSGNNTASDIGNMLMGALVLIGWLYYAKQESSSKQATFGKSRLGIKVTDYSGRTISFKCASIRYFSKILSGLIYGVGYFMAGFTKKKQGLHDIIASWVLP